MVEFKYLYIFLLFISYLLLVNGEIIKIDEDGDFEEVEDEVAEYEAMGNFTIKDTIDLNKYTSLKIVGKKDGRSFVNIEAVESVFNKADEETELELTLENLIFGNTESMIIDITNGTFTTINIINCVFSNIENSAISASTIKKLYIGDSEFNSNSGGERSTIYVDSEKDDVVPEVIMENCTGFNNTADIKLVQYTGGWGCISNSKITFKNIYATKNHNNNVGAVFNLRHCVKGSTITDSLFEKNEYEGKGVIYQYYSVIDISNTTFRLNQGYGAGIYYVYGENTEEREYYLPSTIKNCTFSENTGVDLQRGGAIFADGVQTIDIYDSIFKNLRVVSRGGAFHLIGKSKVTTTNCSFTDIYAIDSGGVFNSGFQSSVVITNCTFKNIYAAAGAIIYGNSGNSIDVENITVENTASKTALFHMMEYNAKTHILYNNVTITNSIASEGIFFLYKNVFENTDLTFRITNSIFTDNGHTAKINTNPVYPRYNVSIAAPVINIADAGYSTVEISNCDFFRNHVNITNGIGGVLSINYTRKRRSVFKNLNFINNTVEADAGGIYIGALEYGFSTLDILLSNITFINNKATESGGGLYIGEIQDLEEDIFRSFEMEYLVFKNNTAGNCGGGMVALTDIFKGKVLKGFVFEYNRAESGGGAYYTKDYRTAPQFAEDPPNTRGNVARFGRFLSAEPARFDFKGEFNKDIKIYSGAELKGFTFQLLDSLNNLYLAENKFSNVKTLTFLQIRIYDEELYLNEKGYDNLAQSENAVIKGSTFELFSEGLCKFDQIQIYGHPGVYYLVFYVPLSGHDNLVHQNLTARLTITGCESGTTGLYPVQSKFNSKFFECHSPSCEGKYNCLHGGQCVRPPFPEEGIEIINDDFCTCQPGFTGKLCEKTTKYEYKTVKFYFSVANSAIFVILVLCIVAIVLHMRRLLFSSSFPLMLILCACISIYTLTSIFLFIDDSLGDNDERILKDGQKKPDDFDIGMCIGYPFIQYSGFIVLWFTIMLIFYKSKPIVALPGKSNATSAQISIRQSYFVQSSNTDSVSKEPLNKNTDQTKSSTDLSISLLEKESKRREELIHITLTLIFTFGYAVLLVIWLIKAIKSETEKNENGVLIKKTINANDTSLKLNQKKLNNGEIIQYCRTNYNEAFTYIQLFLLLFGVTFTNRKWSLGGYHIDLRHFAFAIANWILCGPFLTIITFTMMNDNPNAQLSLYRVSIILSIAPIIPIVVVPKLLLLYDRSVNSDDYNVFAIPFSEKQVSKVTSNYSDSHSQTGTGAASSSFNQGKSSVIESNPGM